MSMCFRVYSPCAAMTSRSASDRPLTYTGITTCALKQPVGDYPRSLIVLYPAEQAFLSGSAQAYRDADTQIDILRDSLGEAVRFGHGRATAQDKPRLVALVHDWLREGGKYRKCPSQCDSTVGSQFVSHSDTGRLRNSSTEMPSPPTRSVRFVLNAAANAAVPG